jgi:cation transport ATPase
MDVAIRHYIPGRVRLHVPALCRRQSLTEAALGWLRAQSGVKTARVNYHCSSIVVEYETVNEELLRSLIGRLRLMSLDDLRVLLASTGVGGSEAPAAVTRRVGDLSPPSMRTPLALPTISLALAFVPNPFVHAVNLPLMLWNGYPVALRAWRVWRREGRLNVDFLDVLAITASLLQGNPVAGALVTWLIKLGDFIRDLTAAGSRRAIRELLEFQAKNAWVVRDGAVVAVPANELKVGDYVVIYPGEMISIDGEIVEGRALIDQKTITGEGLPVTRVAGEAVFAATVIRDGQLTVRATRTGAQTTAGQIAELVESATPACRTMRNGSLTGWCCQPWLSPPVLPC